MRLKDDSLYTQLKNAMKPHSLWHAARIPERLVPVPDRPAWNAVRASVPGVVTWDQEGAGRQFLEFHRHMMRQFKGLVAHTGSVAPAHWTKVPPEFRMLFTSTYLDRCMHRVDELISGGSDDDLGGFIEATDRFTELGSGVHNLAHGYIALHEVALDPLDPHLTDAAMDDPSTAHHNEHFWGLHGWIDDMYAAWQEHHGIPADRSPIAPGRPHGHTTPAVSQPHDHGAPVADQPHHVEGSSASSASCDPPRVTPRLGNLLRARFNPL